MGWDLRFRAPQDVITFIRFLKVIVYEDYIYIRLNEMSKKRFLTFSNFISFASSIITGEHLYLVMNGNMIFMIIV